jgi:hypothetical protein
MGYEQRRTDEFCWLWVFEDEDVVVNEDTWPTTSSVFIRFSCCGFVFT